MVPFTTSMTTSKSLACIGFATMLVVLLCSAQMIDCQPQYLLSNSFGLIDPSTSPYALAVNYKFLENYVAIIRSILVGPYERPLITSNGILARSLKSLGKNGRLVRLLRNHSAWNILSLIPIKSPLPHTCSARTYKTLQSLRVYVFELFTERRRERDSDWDRN